MTQLRLFCTACQAAALLSLFFVRNKKVTKLDDIGFQGNNFPLLSYCHLDGYNMIKTQNWCQSFSCFETKVKGYIIGALPY